MLRKKGFTVIEAADGDSGVAAFRAKAQETGVVLLDMTLPGKSGADVLLELRRIRPGVKVILTTAYSQETVLTAVGKEDSAGFIRKPYHLEDLLTQIQNATRI